MKKIRKILIYMLSTIILLVGILIFLIYIGALNHFVSRQIINQANKYLNGKLSIGKLSGNLLSSFNITEISLTQDSSKKISISKLKIDYSLFALLDNELLLKSIEIDGLKVMICQGADSLWNLEKIYLTPSPADETDSVSSSSFGITICNLLCNDLEALISPIDTLMRIPRSVKANFIVSFNMKGNQLALNVKELSIETEKPNFDIKRLSGDFLMDEKFYQWDQLSLSLPNSQLLSSGKLFPEQLMASVINLNIDTLRFDDIRKILPDFTLQGNPSVALEIEGLNDQLNVSMKVAEQDQQAALTGWLSGLDSIPEFDFALDVSKIDGASWLANQDYTTQINGQLKAHGRSFDFLKGFLELSGNFKEISYQNYRLKDFGVQAKKDSTDVKGKFSTTAWFGLVDAEFRITDFLNQFIYSINLKSKNVNLAQFDLPGYLSSNINLNVMASGKGMNPLEGSIAAIIKSTKSTISNEPVEDFVTGLKYSRGNYELLDLKLNSPFFMLSGNGKGNLKKNNNLKFEFQTGKFNELLQLVGYSQYRLSGKIGGQLAGSMSNYSVNTNFELQQLGTDSLMVHNLIGDLSAISDTGFRLQSAIRLGDIELDSMKVQKINFDLAFNLDDEINSTLKVYSDSVSFNGQLLGDFVCDAKLISNDSIRMDANLKLDSLRYRPFKIGAAKIDLKAVSSEGEVPNNLPFVLLKLTKDFNVQPLSEFLQQIDQEHTNARGQFSAQNLEYDSLVVDNFDSRFDLKTDLNNISGKVSAQMGKANIYGVKFQAGALESSFLNKKFENNLVISTNDSIDAELNLDVDLTRDIELTLRKLSLKTPYDTWRGGGDSTFLSYRNEVLNVSNLRIATNEGASYLKANGQLAMKGVENFDLQICEINLGNVNKTLKLPFQFSGILNGSANLKGTSSSPDFNGNIQLSELTVYNKYTMKVESGLRYKADSLYFTGNISLNDQNVLDSWLKTHLHFSFEEPFVMPEKIDYLASDIKIKELDLSLLKPLIPADEIEIKGIVNADLSLNSQSDDVELKGYLNWDEGKFHYPEYGILYDDLRLKSGIRNDSLYITEFSAKAGAGSMTIDGYTTLDPKNIILPKVIAINLIAKEFKVIDYDRVQATINSNLDLNLANGRPKFSGNLEVIRSEINADAFIADFQKASDEAEPPMLVQAIEAKTRPIKILNEEASDSLRFNPHLELYKNMHGKFKISIPRNTWVKGKDMGFELKGNIEVLKEGPVPVLFGTLEVKQGFYKMYGKRFDFKRGELTLTGDQEINPIVDFEIAYSFRDYQKTLKTLVVKISGRVKQPELAFAVDGNTITEQDALSYLLFGSSSEEISEGQQSTLDASATGYAKDMAFGQMSNILADAVQSSIKLDVVKIEGDDNWNEGSVTIGKYISTNLYVSYQYTFALNKNTKISEPQKVSIEYEFFDFLSLKATNQSPHSGVDLVFKKDFK